MIKTIFDICVSLFLIIVLSIFFIILVLILFLINDGPVFFIQKRVGKNREFFNLIKLRTMTVNTSDLGTHLLKGDEITKVGKVLRKLKIDELPQLYNVISGNMSLVGPRPCLPNQKELIKYRNNFYEIKYNHRW